LKGESSADVYDRVSDFWESLLAVNVRGIYSLNTYTSNRPLPHVVIDLTHTVTEPFLAPHPSLLSDIVLLCPYVELPCDDDYRSN